MEFGLYAHGWLLRGALVSAQNTHRHLISPEGQVTGKGIGEGRERRSAASRLDKGSRYL